MTLPETVYVVRSRCGRDRKRLFLTFGEADAPYPAVYVANGTLHPIDAPKRKNIAHLVWLAPLKEDERTRLAMDMSNKTTAEILANYEQKGEIAKKSAKHENPA